MDPLLVVTAGMGAASLALMLRNMLKQSRLAPEVGLVPDGLGVIVDGRRYVGVVYVADGQPARRASGEALVRTARSMGLTMTIAVSHVRLRKDRLLRTLESEMQRIELALASTGLAKYRERLKFLERLYAEVSRAHTPYASSIVIVVWVPQDKPEARAEAEAFRSLAEAELGVELREARLAGPEELAKALFSTVHPDVAANAAPPGTEPETGGEGVLVGRRSGDPSRLVQLDWPRDLEAHMGVVGPTGRGKTVLLAGLASQLTARLGRLVVVVDPKGDMTSLLGRVADKVLAGTRGAGAWAPGELVVYNLSGLPQAGRGAAAASIVEEALDRAYRGEGAVLVVDEAWRLLSQDPRPLEAAVREGRSLGLHVVYAVQSPGDIPEVILENTRAYAVFGGPGRAYAEAVESLGLEPEGLTRMGVGEAVLKKAEAVERVVVFNFAKYLKPPAAGAWLGRG